MVSVLHSLLYVVGVALVVAPVKQILAELVVIHKDVLTIVGECEPLLDGILITEEADLVTRFPEQSWDNRVVIPVAFRIIVIEGEHVL